jgi:hypothetical protein
MPAALHAVGTTSRTYQSVNGSPSHTEHWHSGLGLHTPHDVHFGLAEPRRAQRAAVLSAAYAARPDRFVHHPPTPATLPTAAWINPPKLLVASEDVRRPHVQGRV